MSVYQSTKLIELGSCAFRQFGAKHSHCQYLHGYQLRAKFVFGSSSLDERNWVVDFGGLKELKAVLQNQFDHTLCIAANDPCIDQFRALETAGACVLRIMPDGVGIEKTAEWCFNAANTLIKQQYGDRCWVESVEVFEHDANSAIYSREQSCNKSTKTDTAVLLNETLVTPTESAAVVEPEPVTEPTPTQPQETAKPAQVGRGKVSTGWSNPFAGTSWGN